MCPVMVFSYMCFDEGAEQNLSKKFVIIKTTNLVNCATSVEV